MPNRNQFDASLTSVKALPAAGASADGTAIDLDAVTLAAAKAILRLDVPATPNLANTITIVYTVQDSADNSSWAAISSLATVTSTGSGGTGAAAIVDQRWALPESTRRYVRVRATVGATGGDNTAVSFTFRLAV